jgi:hypothetical protein
MIMDKKKKLPTIKELKESKELDEWKKKKLPTVRKELARLVKGTSLDPKNKKAPQYKPSKMSDSVKKKKK